MQTSWHDLWGCARGPLTRAAPQTRLVAGTATFAACLIAPASTLWGSLCAVGTVGVWLVVCRPPWRVVRTSLLLGLVLFLPYFLLLPLLADGVSPATGGWQYAIVVPWTVLLRGVCAMQVCSATIASLSASDLREALVRLPVPNLVSAILLQIVQQTATLVYETRRVASAMAVRGASSGGLTAWRVLRSLPRVWLPRVIDRAERVGAAMDLRGYCDGDLTSFGSVKPRRIDGAMAVLASSLLATAIVLRLGAP